VRKADNLPPSCAIVTKSENLNSRETSGPVQASNGTADRDIRPFSLRDGNIHIHTNVFMVDADVFVPVVTVDVLISVVVSI